MEYLMIAMRLIIIAIGAYMIYKNPKPGVPPFMSGIAFILI